MFEMAVFAWGGARLLSWPDCVITYSDLASMLLGTLPLHPDHQGVLLAKGCVSQQGLMWRTRLELVCYSFHMLSLARSWWDLDLNSHWSFDFRRAVTICSSWEFGQFSTSHWLFKKRAEHCFLLEADKFSPLKKLLTAISSGFICSLLDTVRQRGFWLLCSSQLNYFSGLFV